MIETKVGSKAMEEAFLSVVIRDGIDGGLCGLREDNFLYPENRKIFIAIQNLISSNSLVELMSVRQKLEEMGELDFVGGNSKLIALIEYPSNSSSLIYYANKIKSETKRVEILKVANDIGLMAGRGELEASEIIGYADKLLEINTSMSGSEYSLDAIIEDTMNYLVERNGKKLFGYSFGPNLQFLDTYTKGIQKGRTYRIGAVSNLGKSQLAYNIIVNLLEQGVKVAFFTLENEKSFTVTNILANRFKVNSHSIEDGSYIPDFGWLEKFRHTFYLIDGEYDLAKIFAKTLEIKPDVVILDYIGLCSISRVNEDDKYTIYSKKVQEFVKKIGVSWIDLSNLPKDADEDNIRMYGGFYGSSFLRNNADVGIHMFYHKPYYEWKDSFGPEIKNRDDIRNVQVVNMMVTKNRIGTARVEQIFKLDFNKGGFFIPATEEEISIWNF